MDFYTVDVATEVYTKMAEAKDKSGGGGFFHKTVQKRASRAKEKVR